MVIGNFSGITAMLSMLESLTADPAELRPVTFVHAARDRANHAFGPHVRALAARRPNVQAIIVYEACAPGDEVGRHHDHEGRLTTELLRAHLRPGALVYSCGPAGFMAAVNGMLEQLQVPDERRFSEAFAPDASFTVRQARAA